jgi:hypothetical protein
MNSVFMPELDKFVVVFIVDILINSSWSSWIPGYVIWAC